MNSMKEYRECWWCKKNRYAHTFMRVKNRNHEFCWWCYQSFQKGKYHGLGIFRHHWSSFSNTRDGRKFVKSTYEKMYRRKYYLSNQNILRMYQRLLRLVKKDMEMS